MAIKSDAEIYKILERHLKSSKEPLTCTALWDHADIKQHARSAEKVSDFLGLMWRRGLLQRWAVPKTSTDRSRFGYTWNENPADAEPIQLGSTPAKRADVNITEENGRVTLEFEKFTVTIQPRH
jgi:hypothetical protein